MVIACKGIDILKRVLCLLLCVVLLFCFFMVPRANAVLLEGAAAYYAAEVVIGVLATAGVVFASSDDAKSIASSVVGKLKDKTMSTLTAMFAAHSKLISTDIDMAKSAFRVSQDVLQDIIDSFKVDYSDVFILLRVVRHLKPLFPVVASLIFILKHGILRMNIVAFNPIKGSVFFIFGLVMIYQIRMYLLVMILILFRVGRLILMLLV